MKKLVMILGIASLFASGNTLAADSGNVHFKGKVVASTCEVLDDSQDQTVRLSPVQSNELQNGGNGNVRQPFQIELTNCPSSGDVVNGARQTQVSLHFRAEQDKLMNPSQGTALKNTATGVGAAANVGIQVLNQGNPTPINFAAAPKQQGVVAKNLADSSPNGDVVFNFEARYVGEGTDIVPGDVSATVPFIVTYQ